MLYIRKDTFILHIWCKCHLRILKSSKPAHLQNSVLEHKKLIRHVYAWWHSIRAVVKWKYLLNDKFDNVSLRAEFDEKGAVDQVHLGSQLSRCTWRNCFYVWLSEAGGKWNQYIIILPSLWFNSNCVTSNLLRNQVSMLNW